MSQPIDNSFLSTLLDWWIFGFNYLSNSNKFSTFCPSAVTNDLLELFITSSFSLAWLSVEVYVRQLPVNPIQNLVVHQLWGEFRLFDG